MFTIFVDHADFAGANAIVDADKRLSRAFIECDGTSSKVVVRLNPELPAFLLDARTHPEYSTGSMHKPPAARGLESGFKDGLVGYARRA